MRVTPSHFYNLHRPTKCELRLYLDESGVERAPPSPYEEVLRKLGRRHEREHLESLGTFEDLSAGTPADREERTKIAIDGATTVIYQPYFRSSHNISGQQCEVIGVPDFLIREKVGYVVRDAKMSRRITEKDHPEILRQLELYGWLLEQATGQPPIRLEVFSGTSEIVPVDYDGGVMALAELARIVGLKAAADAPPNAVGWSKCGNCGYRDECWTKAEKNRDVALVYGVDQGLALELREHNVASYDDIVKQHDETSLAKVERAWGKGRQRVGKRAETIMPMARALASNTESVLQTPDIPASTNYVMFDLEGLPPHLNELQKIYLWGTQVFGERSSEFLAAVSGFGGDGDRDGWDAFLSNASHIFSEYGDIPFVHWHHYESTNLKMYVNRFGDPDGVAQRVKDNLSDLLPITQRSIALPISSYSLKVVEKYVGYVRSLEEYGGDWAMAQYIEATETDDDEVRTKVMDTILDYNREDLEATWAVLKWLKSKEV